MSKTEDSSIVGSSQSSVSDDGIVSDDGSVTGTEDSVTDNSVGSQVTSKSVSETKGSGTKSVGQRSSSDSVSDSKRSGVCEGSCRGHVVNDGTLSRN